MKQVEEEVDVIGSEAEEGSGGGLHRATKWRAAMVHNVGQREEHELQGDALGRRTLMNLRRSESARPRRERAALLRARSLDHELVAL
jgi:hypothetical protein